MLKSSVKRYGLNKTFKFITILGLYYSYVLNCVESSIKT